MKSEFSSYMLTVKCSEITFISANFPLTVSVKKQLFSV